MLQLQHLVGGSVLLLSSVQSITSVHACSSPNSVEFEGWEMQLEAAESRTEDKDVYLRGEMFTLSKNRKMQP